jgi:hypothetical protein
LDIQEQFIKIILRFQWWILSQDLRVRWFLHKKWVKLCILLRCNRRRRSKREISILSEFKSILIPLKLQAIFFNKFLLRSQIAFKLRLILISDRVSMQINLIKLITDWSKFFHFKIFHFPPKKGLKHSQLMKKLHHMSLEWTSAINITKKGKSKHK